MKKIIIASVVLIAGCLFMAFTNPFSGKPESNVQTRTYKYVKTNSRCAAGNCKCRGYWGKRHDNGAYEGSCSNSDGYGHSCGHGPEKHGLKRY